MERVKPQREAKPSFTYSRFRPPSPVLAPVGESNDRYEALQLPDLG